MTQIETQLCLRPLVSAYEDSEKQLIVHRFLLDEARKGSLREPAAVSSKLLKTDLLEQNGPSFQKLLVRSSSLSFWS